MSGKSYHKLVNMIVVCTSKAIINNMVSVNIPSLFIKTKMINKMRYCYVSYKYLVYPISGHMHSAELCRIANYY